MKTVGDVKNMTKGQLVSWFMISGYAYYVVGQPLMTDPAFDFLVERLKSELPEIDHPHAKLITQTHLEACTGYDINYPKIAQYSTYELLRGAV